RASLPVDHTAKAASTGLRSYWIPGGGFAGILAALTAVFGTAWRAVGSLASSDVVKAVEQKAWRRAPRVLLTLLTPLAAPLLFGGLVLAFMHQGSERSLLVRGTSPWEVLYL